MATNKFRRLLLIYASALLLHRATAITAASENTQIIGLLPRDDAQCQNDQYQKCGGNLPGNFCCEKGSSCVSINGGKTALCCPTGRNCDVIGTIDCDIQQQNATAHPLSQLFTTDLSASLQKCGDLCCPAGMACQGGSQCIRADGDSSKSNSATTSASKTASTSATATNSDTPEPNAAKTTGTQPLNTASSQNAAGTPRCSQFATSGLLVGFFSGLASGVIATILSICCIGRTRSKSSKRDSGDLSSVQASVSDPIYNPDASTSYRTDFLRRTSGPAKSATRTSRASSRVKSLFSARTPTTRSKPSPTSTDPKTPKTPSMKREPSMESIKIYSPPNFGTESGMTRNTQHTTFAQMLENAGLKEGQFLGSPGRVDGRSRPL